MNVLDTEGKAAVHGTLEASSQEEDPPSPSADAPETRREGKMESPSQAPDD